MARGRGGRGQGKFHRGSDVLKNKERVVRICVESSLVLLEDGICYDQCILLAKLS